MLQRTSVFLITGFLGSGKTTLISILLNTAFLNKKVALIENEIGDYSIDAKMIVTKNVQIREITARCLCCSLSNDFSEAVTDILQVATPDIILIETTGVANPLPILLMISSDNRLVLSGIIAVADTLNLAHHIEESMVSKSQLAVADLVYLSKTDVATKEEQNKAFSIVQEINTRAVVTREHAVLFEEMFLPFSGFDAEAYKGSDEIKRGSHLSQDGIETFSVELHRPILFNELEVFLNGLDWSFYRVKGFVDVEGKVATVNFVAGRYTIDFDSPVYCEKRVLVFIGKNISKNKQTVLSLLS